MHFIADITETNRVCYKDRVCNIEMTEADGQLSSFMDMNTCCGGRGGGAFGLHKSSTIGCVSCPNEGAFTNKPVGELSTKNYTLSLRSLLLDCL